MKERRTQQRLEGEMFKTRSVHFCKHCKLSPLPTVFQTSGRPHPYTSRVPCHRRWHYPTAFSNYIVKAKWARVFNIAAYVFYRSGRHNPMYRPYRLSGFHKLRTTTCDILSASGGTRSSLDCGYDFTRHRLRVVLLQYHQRREERVLLQPLKPVWVKVSRCQ